MESTPTASIITPLHNGEKYILDNIRSVSRQTHGNYEHIIINDRSTDLGCQIALREAEKDSRIKVLSNEFGAGAGPARNTGILHAQGRFITFLDCDDKWQRRKLELQVNKMMREKLAFSWTGYEIVDSSGSFLRTQRPAPATTAARLLLKKDVIGCLTAAYDTHYYGKVYMNTLPLRQDFCLWVDLATNAEFRGYKIGAVNEILAYYRTHDQSISANKLRAARMQWRAYRTHFDFTRTQSCKAMAHYAANALLQRRR